MVTISLCMIVKNEEETLKNCLESIQNACDEIIIVDTGSTDNTKQIASNYTNKLFDYQWHDDFSAARNFAFSHATKEYILWLDADDVLLHKDLEKILLIKETLEKSVDGVSMIYNASFDEYGHPVFSYRRNRLVRRDNQFKWYGAVHEYLKVSGNIIESDIVITHNKVSKTNGVEVNRNLNIFENRIKKGETFSPRDLYYYANELKDHHLHKKAIKYYNEFLSTKEGWVEDEVLACLSLADCYSYLGDEEEELSYLLKSLKYGYPLPESCCRLGSFFMKKNDYHAATFWFHTALNKRPINNEGFQKHAYSTWFPHLHLCVCYWKLGEIEKSIQHNKRAEIYRPNDHRVEYNNLFFKNFSKEITEVLHKKKVLYIGWLGYNNLGDELLWELFKENFKKVTLDKEWELTGTIGTSSKEYDIETFDLIVLGGGSIINSDNITFLHEATQKGKKVIIWGTGIDWIQFDHIQLLENEKSINIESYFSKNIQNKLIEIIDQAEYVGVRGQLTYEIIKQMGGNEKKMMVCGDPGFYLSEIYYLDEEYKVFIPFKTKKIIGVNWGTSFNNIYGLNEEKVEDSLIKAIKSLIVKGYKIYLYSIWDQDIPALNSLYNKINDQENVFLDIKIHHQHYLINLISNFYFTINFKLHANIISIAANTPPIALAYRFKVFDFANSIDFNDFIISTNSINIETRILKLEYLINQQRNKIVENLKKEKQKYFNLINIPFDKQLFLY
ncbi:polysaccharide pyruvyl transferase family protein [Bacillus sp. SM2101]|uniref:polysaccharide pyruvyl transferase family protein n=1 Tax=Bacillus sp. SM2101 TaxID=2805366 RepID=UPI001BDE2BAC